MFVEVEGGVACVCVKGLDGEGSVSAGHTTPR
jgi:hypothetical protein